MATPEYAKACEQTPGCAETLKVEQFASKSLWRVHIIRSATGEIRIGRVDFVDVVEGDGVPVGPTYGEHALVGLISLSSWREVSLSMSLV